MRRKAIALGAVLVLGLAGGAGAAPVKGGGWVEAWATGIILNEVVPGTSSPCDSAHECEVTAQGDGTAKNFFSAPAVGKFSFAADYFDDLTTSNSNATGGLCHPAGGTVTVTSGDGSIVLDIEGQHCAIGGDFSRSVITATYFVDGNASTGKYAGAHGAGALSWSVAVGNKEADVIVSFSGNLQAP